MTNERRQPKVIIPILFLITTAWAAGQPPRPGDRSVITTGELADHLDYLASDELEGRRSGRTGMNKAIEYSVTQLRGAGLTPLITNSKGKPDYTQSIQFYEYELGDQNHLTLNSTDHHIRYAVDEDYYVIRPGRELSQTIRGHPVNLGYGIHLPDLGWDDLAGQNFKGHPVILQLGGPEDQDLPAFLQTQLRDLGGLHLKIPPILAGGASCLLVVATEEMANRWQFVRDKFLWNIADLGQTGSHWLSSCPVPVLLVHPRLLDALDLEKPAKAAGQDPSNGLEGWELSLRCDFLQREMVSSNVVAGLHGIDPSLADQYILLSAHLDHLGVLRGEIHNGADDNASSCAALLEIAEYFAEHPTRHSLIFVLFTLEEVGVLGSGYFVDHPPVPIDSIVANINMEMLGYLDRDEPSSFVSSASEPVAGALAKIIAESNRHGLGLPLRLSASQWAGSDHYHFWRKGIPSTWIATIGGRSHYHQPGDDVALMNLNGIQAVALLVAEAIQAMDQYLTKHPREPS